MPVMQLNMGGVSVPGHAASNAIDVFGVTGARRCASARGASAGISRLVLPGGVRTRSRTSDGIVFWGGLSYSCFSRARTAGISYRTVSEYMYAL
eukprot:COSAG02_NODE_26536_length_630_cov_34.320151_1_plen_94_part_00